MKEISGIEEFDNYIKNSEKTIIVDFWATWCGPCRLMLPILEEISTENKMVEIIKVSMENKLNKDIGTLFNIKSIPTMIIIKNGKEVDRKVGMTSKNDLLSFIK